MEAHQLIVTYLPVFLDLMQSGKIDELQKSLNEFYELCGEIRCMHDSSMGLLPPEEKERHETWMKAKMMFNNEFIHSVEEWVKCV